MKLTKLVMGIVAVSMLATPAFAQTLKQQNASLQAEVAELQFEIQQLQTGNSAFAKLNKDNPNPIGNNWANPLVYDLGSINFNSYGAALSTVGVEAYQPYVDEWGMLYATKGTMFKLSKHGQWYNMTKESGRQKFLNHTAMFAEIGELAKLKSNRYVFTPDGWSKVSSTSTENKDTNGYTTNELLGLAGYTNESTDAIGAWMWSGPGGKFVNFKTSSKGTIRNLIKKVAKEAYVDGYDDGYEDGYNDGYRDGFYDGRSGAAYAGN